MRASASTSSAKIVAMPLGSTVDVIKELDGWYEIIYNGKSGYVMSKFCEKI
uniref:SH3 domain protein n=1 Tax=Siphoviridae sp. ctxMM9 TaxID=2827973 RepID=A0A8S5T5R3_9CAUD|nr:MAG TPA: SH3 domain protein [Siphoviridae sp. ctxMM9]